MTSSTWPARIRVGKVFGARHPPGTRPEQEAEYAQLDRGFMEQAPWAPYGTFTVATFVSSEIELEKIVFNPTFGQDLTSFQFK